MPASSPWWITPPRGSGVSLDDGTLTKMTESGTPPDHEGRVEPAAPSINLERDPPAKPEPAATAAAAPANDRTPELASEVARLKDQLLRALAEQENVRRRAQRERDDAVKYAAQRIANDLLSTADNL